MTALAETVATWAANLDAGGIPEAVRATARCQLLDVAGLCIAARDTDYVRATVAASDAAGPCTALGHAGGFDAAGAALINGTAAHGEDFDDTFEGTPVHPGAVAVPALLAACEAHTLSGAELLRGLATASELMCRLALVAPTAQHRAGFHPTAVLGAFGAAAGVGAALGLSAPQITHALGIAGSMASGIIEYLAEGAWTKRLHPGWAAQSGYRAARLAAAGFTGPRTVFEGTHGFFSSFGVPDIVPDYTQLTDGLGADWRMTDIAFKPYACGTIAQPFIDAAIMLADQGIAPARVAGIRCKVGEGTVHRLWEPRAEKVRPSTPYSAKFSVPYCVAVGLLDRAAGLAQFTQARIADPDLLALAAKVHYEIDPANPYPASYTAHLTVTLEDGSVVEAEQPHLRGGRHEPLTDEALAAKFAANIAYGGWPAERAAALEQFVADVFDRESLAGLNAFRG
jgi:2-methylcitrate dehydratase PrpD